MSCFDTFGQTLSDYGLRSIGYGERQLPASDITVCDQIVLIGSGMIWNLYFGAIAVFFGFFLATLVALGKMSPNPVTAWAARSFIFVFRGTPLFLQFFFAYSLFVALPLTGATLSLGPIEMTLGRNPLTSAALGALIVLFLNTAAYSGEIFYGALRATPKGDLEAADAYGLSAWRKFRAVTWPTLLRLAWPAYTNEAIFLFHATTLVFFSAFGVWRREADALYYANYFAEKTYNPFVPYPIVGAYFIVATLALIGLFGLVNHRLNRHLPRSARPRLRIGGPLMR